MRKWIIFLFFIIISLTGCGLDSGYLDRAVGVYFDTEEKAAKSNDLSTTYGFVDGESSHDKRLQINIGEQLDIEKVMTNAEGSYSIGYIAKDGTLQWHTFYNVFEKVNVSVTDTKKPYVVREKNEVYYKKDYEIYYPRHARYKLYISGENLIAKPTTNIVCKKVGDLERCHKELKTNEIIN